MLHVFITFYLVWCNVLMHIYIYVCLLVLVRLRFALRLDCDLFPSFEESKIKRWRSSDQALQVHKVEDPEHLFGEGKCPLTHYVLFTL
jgi:hypothetical protein